MPNQLERPPEAERPVDSARVGWRFWLGYAALHALLFLPAYALNRPNTTFWPTADGSDINAWLTGLFVWRNNLDLFRLNAEVALLLALWAGFGRILPPFLRRLAAFFYVIAFAYAIYEAAMRTLYQLDPVFYSQLPFIRDGIGIVVENLQLSPWTLAGGILALSLTLIGVGALFGRVAALSVKSGWASRSVLWGLAAFALGSVVLLGGRTASPKTVVNSAVVKLAVNVAQSAELYRSVQSFDASTPQTVYDYSDETLLRTPNIYLIFVESYGSVLYKRADWQARYAELTNQASRALAADGWHTATALSDAPTWGGGSWMSYTSAMFGLRIDTQPQYLALFDTYSQEPYPDLGDALKRQGYTYTRVSPIFSTLKDADWDAYEAFFGSDAFLQFSDLAYAGLLYGWGPAPPDQYALNYARERVLQSAEPQLLFYITQNSHYPWSPVPDLADDWRSLNTGELGQVVVKPDPTQLPRQAVRANYIQSIEYTLSMLFDFILSAGDEDALFILIGDHQPQQVSGVDDGFDTPVHVISRDAGLVDAFVDLGLERGLMLREPTPIMRHEGVYSMVMRALLAQYGTGLKLPPPYLPEGIVP